MTTPLPGGESSSPLTLVQGSKACAERPTTKTERATSFLEDAYDGAQARIEVLEERVRELHLLVAVAANGEYGPDWISAALEVLASIPADPTLI